jgi:hypothetical protein
MLGRKLCLEDIYLSIVNIVFYLTFVLAVEDICLSIVNIVFYLTFVPAVEEIYLSIVNKTMLTIDRYISSTARTNVR